MKHVLLLLVMLYAGTVSAQLSPAQKYVNNIDSFYRLSPYEKAFLHTDKQWYFPGETIWMKIYVTVDNELTELSRIVYVDLSDQAGNIIEKTRWKLHQLHATADIYVSKTLKPGSYILRAYTKYMLNTPAVIDEKVITVISDSTGRPKADTGNLQPHLLLFPEGGTPILNLPCKVAYKLTLPNQTPLQDVTVTVSDNDHHEIFTGKPMHDGMGYFTYTPENRKSYQLTFEFNGVTYTRAIPAAEKEGVVLEVNNTNPRKVFLSLKTNNPHLYESVIVMAQMSGVTVYAQNYDLREGSSGGAIDKSKLPGGVITITCFSVQMRPLCERVVYNNNFTFTDPVFSMDALNVSAKAENKFSIENLPDSGSFSISVTDADVPETPFFNHNMITYFLLGSEVKGYIHNPSYYFKKKDSATAANLDLLLLTNGWRRFRTEDVLLGKMPTIRFYPETGITISGKVKDQFRAKLNTGGLVNAIIKTEDSTTIFTDAVFSENGRFIISGLDFKQKANVLLKETTEHKGLTTAIELDPVYFDTLTSVDHNKHQLYSTTTDSLSVAANPMSVKFEFRKTNNNELAEIIITGKPKSKEQQLTDEYASEQFKNAEYTFLVDSNTAYHSIWQYLQAYVPGISIGTGIDPTVNFSRNTGLREASTGADNTFIEDINGGKSSIAFYLNEILVPIESITDLNPKDVALVKVNRNPRIGMNAMHGSIFFYTKKGTNKSNRNSRMITGYHVPKEYFPVIYNTPESKSASDYRSTMYWNPDLKIVNKKTTIQFFNNDITRRFRVILCGFDKDGVPVYLERIIQ